MDAQPGQLIADVHAGRIEYDDQKAADCVDDIVRGHGPGSCSATIQLSAAELSSCRAAIRGNVGLHGACFAGNECAAQFFCDLSRCTPDKACCKGSCEAVAPAGGNCSAPGVICAENAFCNEDFAGRGLLCQRKAAAGNPCVGSSGCEAGSICIFDFDRKTGTCGTLPKLGQRCAPAGGPRCDSTAGYCDEVSGICTARAGVGRPCPQGTECALFARCDPTSGVCVERGGPGAACTADAECLGSLPCVHGSCSLPGNQPPCKWPTSSVAK